MRHSSPVGSPNVLKFTPRLYKRLASMLRVLCREACVNTIPTRPCSEHRRNGTFFALKEEALLGRRTKFVGWGVARSRGFSLTELVVTLAVMLVLAAIAIPSITRAFAVYQLNDCASRVAGILKFTRYEAIRLNKPVPGTILATGPNWSVFADTNGNGVPDPTEAIDIIVPPLTLLPAGGMPNTSPISNTLGSPSLVLTSASAMNTTIIFDSRGAVLSGNYSLVYVLYLGNPADTDIGYRAVVLMPSGMVQVWSSATGTWQLVG